jgi:hypothetical protein
VIAAPTPSSKLKAPDAAVILGARAPSEQKAGAAEPAASRRLGIKNRRDSSGFKATADAARLARVIEVAR